MAIIAIRSGFRYSSPSMFSYSNYILLPILSALVTGTLAVAVHRRRETPAARYVFWIMVILAVWSLSYALNTATEPLLLKVLLYRVATTFAVFIGVLTLALALELLGYGSWLTPSRKVLLCAIPVTTSLLAWTSGFHHLLRHSFYVYQSGPLLLLGFEAGPGWTIYMAYQQAMLAAANILFLVGFARGPAGYRTRFFILAVGAMTAQGVELFNPTPVPGFRIVTSTLWFTGLCYAQAIYRLGLFKVAPAARAALFDLLDEPVLVFDNRGTLADANRAARNLLAANAKTSDNDLEQAVFTRFPSLRSIVEHPGKPDGSLAQDAVDANRHWGIKALPLLRGPFAMGLLVELNEVTAMKQTEEQIRQAHQIAESANQAKSTFLANTSHEIRTPLSAIMGFTELVLNSDLTEEQRGNLEIVRSSSESLLMILNDILDAAKIEAGRMVLEEVDFHVPGLIDKTLQSVMLEAEAKKLKLRYSPSPEVPLFLKGDPVRLRQVLLNLLGNAIKFTDVGEVTLTAGVVQPDDAQQGVEQQERPASVTLLFCINDTGIGIPAEKQSNIFLSFTQADSSITRKYGGTGLGLTISRELVRIMGGELKVQSEEGKGSSFCFTARFKKSGEVGQMIIPAPISAGSPHRVLKILLAEDTLVSRMLTVRLLQDRGHRVIAVENGLEVLDLLKREDFDLVLMDDRMPVLDGCETTRIIRDRTSSVLSHDIPVIALSASVFSSDRKRFREAGMNDCLAKAVRYDELVAMVEMHAAQGPGSSGTPQHTQQVMVFPANRAENSPHAGQRDSQGQQDLLAELKAEILDRYSGDKQLVDELLLVCRQEVPRLVRNIREAYSSGDRALLEMHAHSCKSAAGSVGFSSLTGIAASLEQAARTNDLSDIEARLKMLEQEVQRFMNATS